MHDTATTPSHFNFPRTPGCGLPHAACVDDHIVKTWSMLMLMYDSRAWGERRRKTQPSKRSLTQQHKFGGRDDKHRTVKPCLPLGRDTINAPVVSGGIFICHNKWQFECLSMTTNPISPSFPGKQLALHHVFTQAEYTHCVTLSSKPQTALLLGPTLMRQAVCMCMCVCMCSYRGQHLDQLLAIKH